eukprot:CAMPEP_0183805902 /NCGR_PEP_ID=MMETSP0803_2-20130417/38290_1 /TAXON_ID=195967 /ORGANISM="Crustomastix stigmata, Strain CCMP3273" /LENGTH=295 /DNA_ID=CAMNT_0026050661 /DNA_START=118 /DNA_END=1005 /DNA_ORIENTATION=-
MVPPSKSMFGPQISSTKPSFPAYGFGTSVRMSSTRLFHTKEQTASNVGMVSPGPIYDVPSAVGAQTSSKNVTAPSFKFGARSISDSNLTKESRPGPGTYETEASLGRQTTSQKNTSAAWKFGTSNRWSNFKTDFKHNYETPGMDYPRPASGWLGDAAMFSFGTSGRHVIGMGNPGAKPSFQLVPGPGTYTAPSSLGLQMTSQRGTAAQFKFGTATRLATQKVYLTHAHEREYLGQHSPAPNAYKLNSSLGVQQSSRNLSAPNFKFGSADRFSEIRTTSNKLPAKFSSPGPGSYGV